MLIGKSKYSIFIILFLQLSHADRRIRDGVDVTTDNRFVVYLLKAPKANVTYDHWLCGGALVTAEFIVTSAACVEDVEFFYAIAGYNKYVNAHKIDSDPCTRERKKKVVFICVPKTYTFDYDKVEKWAFDDIAVVKVESPYNLNDEQYARECSYTPAPIAINYDPKYQNPGIDAVVFGWGHRKIWRQQNDSTDHNQFGMQFAAVLLHDKEDCKKYYSHNSKMTSVIDSYMICSMGVGNLNDAGEPMKKPRLMDGCVTKIQRMAGMEGPPCNERTETEPEVEVADEIIMIDDTRRQSSDLKNTNNDKETIGDSVSWNGICQNDHGGPLVTWVGAHPMLIGVASVFRVNNRSECEGPYLFTSTQCSSAFLDCILTPEKSSGRRDLCNAPPEERGFDMIERQISWAGHPDGPADNEKQRMDQYNRPVEKGRHQMEEQYYRPLESEKKPVEQQYNRPMESETQVEQQYSRPLEDNKQPKQQQDFRPTDKQHQQLDQEFESLLHPEEDKRTSIEKEIIDSLFNFHS